LIFRAAGEVFEAAARRGLAGERRMLLAGVPVRVRFVGPRLGLLLTPAFAHLPSPESETDALVITAVDGTLDEAAPLAPLIAQAACAEYGDTARVVTEGGQALQWIPDASKLPAWAAASPMRTLLASFLATRGLHLVHAAAVSGLMLAAKGGSGKSTSALASLGALPVAGDDFVVLDPARTRVHALYGTAKVGRAQAGLFPRLERLGGPFDDPEQKAVLHVGALLAPWLDIRAIAVPSLALHEAETHFEPIPRAQALRALAPSSIFLVPGAGAETLRVLGGLAAALPAYALRIGHDVTGIPRAIEALLAEVDRG
jgi:hypothetical protein